VQLFGNVLQFCFDYGIDPEDEVNSLSFPAAMFFCTFKGITHAARLRSIVARFRLAGGYATARERGFILPTEAFAASVAAPFDCSEKMSVTN
jgi:hypothetical protein